MTTPVQEAKIGKFTISKGSPVRVKSKKGIWMVVSMTERPSGGVAVEVIHTVSARSRTFDLGELVYVQPSSKKAELAESHRDNTRVITKAMVPDKPVGRRVPRRKTA